VARGPSWEVVGTADASDTSYIVRGLRSGTDYYFRVIAENGAGASVPLTMDKSFIPKKPYGEFLLAHLHRVSHVLNFYVEVNDLMLQVCIQFC
jgi:Fibronectin type III domain